MAALEELQQQVLRIQEKISTGTGNVATTVTTNSVGGLPEAKHLDGKNYGDWKFWMQNFLIDAGLWRCVSPKEGQTVDPDLDLRALAKINLSLKPCSTRVTKKCQTAKAAWDALRGEYESTALVRLIGLYSSLFKTNFENFPSMQQYVDHILSIAEQLESIGQPFQDNVVGGIILGGLPDQYRPLILGIQGSKQDTTVEFVKSLLLQDSVKELGASTTSVATHSAFSMGRSQMSRSHKGMSQMKSKPKGPRCFECNRFGHIRSQCEKVKVKPHKNSANANFGAVSAQTNFSVSSVQPTSMNDDWYLDSGATVHLTSRLDLLKNFSSDSSQEVGIANGTKLKSTGMGTLSIPLSTKKTMEISDVVHVPDLAINLLAVNRIAQEGKTVLFDKKGCRIVNQQVKVNPKSVIGTATEVNGLYRLNCKQSRMFAALSTNSVNLWHRRLGHLNRPSMRLLRSTMSSGVQSEGTATIPCEVCVKGKQHRKPFKKTGAKRAKHVLGLVHSDICGPMHVSSVGGARYFLTLIDDFTRHSVVYFLKSKTEVLEKFKEYKSLVENQTGKRIKTLRTDNGTEYVNENFLSFLRRCGIRHETTIPYTPQQNGVAERLNRTLVERARTMILESGVSTDFWAEAVNTANYLKNRSPTKVLPNMTPQEAWTGEKPDLSHLRVFGCKALVKIPDNNRKKWDSKSKEYIFVGYCEESKGYRMLHPVTKKFTRSRDVVFFESQFPVRHSSSDDPFPDVADDNSSQIVTSDIHNQQQFQNTQTHVEVGESDGSKEFGGSKTNLTDDSNTGLEINSVEEDSDGSNISVVNKDITDDGEVIRDTFERPKRTRIPNKQIFNENFVVHQATLCKSTDPATVEEALTSQYAEEWKRAMEEEIQAHVENQTWTLSDVPTGRKAIKCKWVFKTKLKSDGTVERYKARLVAKGCSQKPGIDYEETYSPVVRYTSIRLLMALAAKYDLDIDQMDVTTAFLHPELEEEIYMELPGGFRLNGKTCRLKKSIYGLKQASRAWNKKLDKLLKELGFVQSNFDTCIYYRCENGKILIIAVYVDDLLILSNNKGEKQNLKADLMKRLKMKDLGEAHYCVGIHIQRDRDTGTISLDQEKYIEQVLNRFNMTECNGVSTPLDSNQDLFGEEFFPNSQQQEEEMRNIPFQEAVGSLMYAAQATRPDIAFAVGVMSRFNNNYGKTHWVAVKRIFRYLRQTASTKLVYRRTNEDLIGFCDSDWGGDKRDLKSTTGYTFVLSGAAISWNSKKQPTVAKSTTEAEYMALSMAATEAIWLKGLHKELVPQASDVVEIFCDNKGAIDLARNPGYRPKTKHIAVQHHFIRDRIAIGDILVKQIETTNMVADCLTKGLCKDLHNKCISGMGLEK